MLLGFFTSLSHVKHAFENKSERSEIIDRAKRDKTNYCSFVRSVLRNGETDGQAVRTGEFGGTNTAMQGNGVFDNRQT